MNSKKRIAVKIISSINQFGWLLVLSLLFPHASSSAQANESSTKKSNGYVARQDSLRNFFSAVSSHIGKPIIVSKLSAAKQISGDFNLADADIVNKLSRQLGLVNYSDGYAIYIYDASETKNSVLSLKNISTKTLLSFLKKSGLIDARFPLRSDGIDTFYLAGPPIYVDLVMRAAEFMDIPSQDQEKYRVEIIKLNNTFVTDRSYTRRDENILIPGIANVIEKLLAGEVTQASSVVKKSNSGSGYLDTPIDKKIDVSEMTKLVQPENTEKKQAPSQIRIIAYPETNSLLVKGSADQIRFVRNLVEALDEEKRHVELALWIIDLEKDDLDQLGVSWQGAISKGKLSLSMNADNSLNSFSTLEGGKFIASILALTRKNKAQIVSRPVVLTQENTPAMFDNNRTFYTPLISERAVDLQKVTYGTMVHVLPRFTIKDEIELSLNIEDGNEMPRTDSNSSKSLPTVGRTKISTVARVPKGKSLLVGGYTRGETGEHIGKIPLLGDLPFIGGVFRYNQTSNKNTVRVFLIRPREITDGFDLNSENITESIEEGNLIKGMDKTREMMQQKEGIFNGS